MIALHTRVVLVTDAFESEGARRGMLGYIVEHYPDGKYEVEFSDSKTGITLAQVVVEKTQIEARPELGPSGA